MTKVVTEGQRSSLTKINTAIKSVSTAYGKARDKAQETGLLIIAHAKEYGDCTAAVRLARAVPARERNSLIGWFSLFSPIGIQMGKTSADDKVRFIKPESKSYNDFNIDGAKANPWYDDPANVNPEPKPLNTFMDFTAVVTNMLKKAIKDAESGEKYTPEAAAVVKAEAESLLKIVGVHAAKRAAATQGDTLKTETTNTDPVEQMRLAVANA